jgi:hypothetical protein
MAEVEMARGKEIWEAAAIGTKSGSERSANAMRFYALSRMLAEAETSALMGMEAEATQQLVELQAHVEILAARLAASTAEPRQEAA